MVLVGNDEFEAIDDFADARGLLRRPIDDHGFVGRRDPAGECDGSVSLERTLTGSSAAAGRREIAVTTRRLRFPVEGRRPVAAGWHARQRAQAGPSGLRPARRVRAAEARRPPAPARLDGIARSAAAGFRAACRGSTWNWVSTRTHAGSLRAASSISRAASSLATTPRRKTWPEASTVISTCPLTGGTSRLRPAAGARRPSCGLGRRRLAGGAREATFGHRRRPGRCMGCPSSWRRHQGESSRAAARNRKTGRPACP